MAVANAVAFWMRVQSDKSLQERVIPGSTGATVTKDATPAEWAALARIANSEGFQCKPEELLAVENVVSFLEALPRNTELQNAVSQCDELAEPAAAAETVRIAGEHGYAFTAQDLAIVISSSQSGLLGDEALDRVAGGVNWSQTTVRSGGFRMQFLGFRAGDGGTT